MILAKKLKCRVAPLQKTLWGDYYVAKEKGKVKIKRGAAGRGKAPLFPDISRPASALVPRTPPPVNITYEASRVEAARRLLEKVRRGMRGLGGYSGSDAQSDSPSSTAHRSSRGTSQGCGKPSTPFLEPHCRNPAQTRLPSSGSLVM